MVSTEPKKIVFGATGGTGLECVKQLISQGQKVVAYVRNPEKLQEKLENQEGLTIIKGDIRDLAKLKECFTQNEFDQILLSLGANTIWSPDDTCSTGTKNILAALKETAQKPRIIMCGSGGVDY